MTDQIYTIYDTKAEIFLVQPFCVPTHGAAERDFSDIVNHPDSKPFKHPEDYHLYHLGEWDHDKKVITGLDVMRPVMSALSVKKDLTLEKESV